MFGGLVILHLLGITIVKDIFYLVPLGLSKIAILIVLGLISLAVFYLLQVVVERIIGIRIRK